MARGRRDSLTGAQDGCESWTVRVSKREEQALELACKGHTDREISEMLQISPDTVGTYWRRLLTKFDAASRTEVVAKIAQQRAKEVLSELQRQNDLLQREVSARALAEARETAQRKHLEAIQTSAIMILDSKTQRASFVRLLDELILVGRCTGAALFECRNSTPGKAFFVARSSCSNMGKPLSASVKAPGLMAKLRTVVAPVQIDPDAACVFLEYMSPAVGQELMAIPVVHGQNVLGFVVAAFSHENEMESIVAKCSSILAFLTSALKFKDTERRRAMLEELLDKASRRQKMLIDALPIGLLYENGKREAEYINYPLLDLLGSSSHPRELVGREVAEVFHDLISDASMREFLESFLSTDAPRGPEFVPGAKEPGFSVTRKPIQCGNESQGWIWCFNLS